MSNEDRQHLAEQQAMLVGALVNRGAPPAAMDPARVSLTARTLLNKRSRAVEKALPRMAEAMGDQFAARFQAYAAESPLDDDADDALRFVRWLLRQGALGDPVRVIGMKILAANWRPIVAGRLDESRRYAIAVRWPFFGVRVIRVY